MVYDFLLCLARSYQVDARKPNSKDKLEVLKSCCTHKLMYVIAFPFFDDG
jgi:hypothetical protein